MERWVGRVALVTGASAGIGAEICKTLVKEGLKVIGCARNVDKINKLSDELKEQNSSGTLHAVRCDLSNENDILSMFQEIKEKYLRLDVCINNAGLAKKASLLTGSTEEWKEMINVNILGLSICTREAFKLMQESKCDDGHFIHINSTSGRRLAPGTNTIFYSGTKQMVTTLTEGLRRELHEIKSPFRVAQICPGVVETEFMARMTNKEQADKFYSSSNFLQGEDIASVVKYILSCPPHVNINDVMMRSTEQKF